MIERGRNEGLQALRGIAALLVFIEHLLGGARLASGEAFDLGRFRTGGIGVFLFFALSGYLMAGKASDPPLKFLIDRARRIYPTFWAAVAFNLFVINAVMGGTDGTTFWQMILVPAGTPKVLHIPYWSLFYELGFYALVFAVMTISPRAVTPVILTWAVVGFVFQDRHYDWIAISRPSLWTFAFSAFAIYFGCGVMARWVPRGPASLYGVLAVALWTGAVYFAQGGYLPDLVVGISTMFAVAAALNWRAGGPVSRLLVAAGNCSYGLYLTHLMFLAYGVWLLQTNGLHLPFWPTVAVLTVIGLTPALLFGWAECRAQALMKIPRLKRSVVTS